MPAPRRNAAPARSTIPEQLRTAIKEDGRSEYQIAKAAGAPRSCLSDFMSGARGLNLDTFGRLAEAIGLRLVESGRRGGRRARAIGAAGAGNTAGRLLAGRAGRLRGYRRNSRTLIRLGSAAGATANPRQRPGKGQADP